MSHSICSPLPDATSSLIPLVLAKGAVGNELQHPLALVILGGLVSSTLLNLFVIPAGFAIFGPGSLPVRPSHSRLRSAKLSLE